MSSDVPRGVLLGALVAGMLITGVCNTLLTKYQDMQCVRNCDDPDPTKRHVFEQPVLQTLQMFIGEMGCWLIVGFASLGAAIKNRNRESDGYEPIATGEEGEDSAQKTLDKRIPMTGSRVLLLAIPACCDITGTTLMNVGLLFTAASIYQMTRGALIIFVGIFSVLFLKREVKGFQWFSMFLVVLGVAIVGMAGVFFPDPPPHERLKSTELAIAGMKGLSPVASTIIGVCLIAFAQIFTATQFVVEEWILEKYGLEPLKVVGWEGIFGFSITLLGMIILHILVGSTEAGRYGYFDAVEGWRQFTQYRVVAISSVLIMISIGGFNFFGLSVTRSISATARSIIDTCRTLFIWIVSLALHWESFKWLQIIGFALLVYGTFVFNQIIASPFVYCQGERLKRRAAGIPQEDGARDPLIAERGEEELLPERPIEHL
ncbi:integral membrane protein [Ascodesmis nigricans]|uniref:Integral membrane protein n=1 Tax=Ascodesmis nigricans TaxID=341454 RepID=A0A4S2MPS0_9PEZI|nr:integral membrane protein [Ascodesmis nigricans]